MGDHPTIIADKLRHVPRRFPDSPFCHIAELPTRLVGRPIHKTSCEMGTFEYFDSLVLLKDLLYSYCNESGCKVGDNHYPGVLDTEILSLQINRDQLGRRMT